METALVINGCSNDIGPTYDILETVATILERHGIGTEIVHLGDMEELFQKIRDTDILIWGLPISKGKEPDDFKRFLDQLYATVCSLREERNEDLGKQKKGSIILTCTEPDGDMKYQDSLIRMMSVMRFLGITDLSGAIIPDIIGNGNPTSQLFKDYIDALEFQLW